MSLAISRFASPATPGHSERTYSLEMLLLSSVWAMPYPMPRVPPVTTPTLPVRSGHSSRPKCDVPILDAMPPKFSAIVFYIDGY